MISIGMTNSKISMKIYKKSETVRQRVDTLITDLESDALESQKDDSTRHLFSYNVQCISVYWGLNRCR